MADQNHISELKAAADPVALAAALGLRGHGKRFFCPICQPDGGKTPDLSVRDSCFVCHKCGIKGDLVELVKVAAGLDFKGAVAWLEDFTGLRSSDRYTGTHKYSIPKAIVQPGASYAALQRPVTTASAAKVNPSVYDSFLAACRPVEGRPLEWLTMDRGISPDVVKRLGLRFCGREYQDILSMLKTRFSEDDLLTAGLLKRGKDDRLVGSWYHYFVNKAGFLVIPYFQNGRPVFLKVRPPMGKSDAEQKGLIRFMNTGTAVPCLYNLDALADKPDKVLLCEGESDTWTALSYGYAALGVPGANNFKAAWVDSFRGLQDANARSRVYLALDGDIRGKEGSAMIASLFVKAGLPVPLKLDFGIGKDLTEFMKEGRTA